MSKLTILAFVVMMALTAFAASVQKTSVEVPEVEPQQEVLDLETDLRDPRITCDLLSGLGWAHTFCAAHCIFKGYKGGYCASNGVCKCRN